MAVAAYGPERATRSQGRDRDPRSRPVHRVVAAGATVAAAAAAPHPRRAGRVVAVGALHGLLRRPRMGGSRPQPPEPLLVAVRGSGDALVRHLPRGRTGGPRPVRDER